MFRLHFFNTRTLLDAWVAALLLSYVMICYEFLSRIASSILRVNCFQRVSCVGGPSAFNSPFGHRSRSHNIRLLDNHLFGLSISLSSLALSWVYQLPLFKSLVWLGCDSNSQPPILVASALPLHYQSMKIIKCWLKTFIFLIFNLFIKFYQICWSIKLNRWYSSIKIEKNEQTKRKPLDQPT